MQFESVVTEMYQDAFVGSSIDNGTTVLQCDLRQHDLHRELGLKAKRCWRNECSHVDVHALSTFPNPIPSRFLIAQGSSLDDQHQRLSFPPELQGVSTSQPMRHSVIRWACDLAGVCGGSLRHMALLFAARFLLPMSTSSITRWIDDIGSHVPKPEERLQQLLARTPVTECHLDGDSPLGTENCVMVVKEAHERLLIAHEATAETGEDARPFLQRVKDGGLHVTAACSDDSPRCTAAIKAVWPQARFPADHVQTVKHMWGHRKKSLSSYRRQGKASGESNTEKHLMAMAKQ
jgi:hypothetical protein